MYVCRDASHGQIFTDSTAQLDQCEALPTAPPLPTGATSTPFPAPIQPFNPQPVASPPPEMYAAPSPAPLPQNGLDIPPNLPGETVMPPTVTAGTPPADAPPPCPVGINPLNRFSAPPCPSREQPSPTTGGSPPADQPSSAVPQ